MRKAIAIHGASEEALALIPILEENPEIEIVGVFATHPEEDAARAQRLDIAARVSTDPALFERPLHAVIDAAEPAFAKAFPDAAHRTQVVSPLTARLLWGYGSSVSQHKAGTAAGTPRSHRLGQPRRRSGRALSAHARDRDGVTGADGGSLMLFDTPSTDLHDPLCDRESSGNSGARSAWPSARASPGAWPPTPDRSRSGARRGRTSSAWCVYDSTSNRRSACHSFTKATSLGVLNLHHTGRADAFDDDDLEFAEQLGRLDAAIIAQAEEHAALRRQASRYEAVRAVREALHGNAALDRRLAALCDRVAGLLGGGIATVYLHDANEHELRLTATSLDGGGLGGDYRVRVGQGVDGRVAEQREPEFFTSPTGEIAMASLPLIAGDALLGVLSIQAGATRVASSPRALRETLLEIAAATAEEVAQAEREARMEAQSTKSAAINEAGIRLISARETAEVCRQATSSGALILEADHAILRLQDPETRRYVIRSYYGSADRRTQEQLFRLDKQISVGALKSRQPRLVSSLASDPATAEVAAGFRSALAAPLRSEGRVLGTLAFYDKIASDQFFATAFHEEDLLVFRQYVSYVERALETAQVWAANQVSRNFDEDTGLPNADYLARRLDQELARAAGRENAMVLVSCRLENLDALSESGDPARSERVILHAADALKRCLREFDVVARTDDAEFQILLPDPGESPEERVTTLARAVAEEVTRHAATDGTRPGLAFGFAVYPADGQDRETLSARTRTARIRMV